MRYVVCAALSLDLDVILGPRHFDSTMRLAIDLLDLLGYDRDWSKAEQGFVDQHGVFMTRQEAYQVAVEAKQIRRPEGGPVGVLYSEHLY